MFAIKPWLAALALAPVPFVVLSAARYNRRSRPAVQEIQQRLAELTAEVEESISGIRIVKAFARERHMLGRFRRSVVRVFDQNIYSTRLQAFYSPMLGFLPSLGLAVVLLVGGREVINGGLSLGDFAAFYTYLIMLTVPMRMLGHVARDGAAGGGVGKPPVRDPRPRAEDREPARRARRFRTGPGRVELRDVSLAYNGGAPALEDVDLAVERGTDGGAGRAHRGRARPAWSRSWRASMTRAAATVARRRRRPAVGGRPLAALRSGVRGRRQLPVLGQRGREHRLRPAGRQPRGDRVGRAARAGAGVHRAAPRRLRDDDRRARADALGRSAAAGRDRPRAAGRPADPDPRRRHLVGRRADGGRDQAGLREAMVGQDDVHRRPPDVDHLARRRGGGDGRRHESSIAARHEELLERCPLYAEIAEHGMEDSVFLQRDLERREEVARL